MLPGKDNNTTALGLPQKEKIGSFAFFDIEHFVRRLLKNWYWFALMAILGFGISYIYEKYYAQRVYQSSLSLSISNNTAAYFTPNQSINFIWGQSGNQDGLFLKKMLLSRTHNEYLVNQLNLYTYYATKGLIKQTYLDKLDSPVFLEVDRSHLQQVNYPITLLPKGSDKYEVILPEEGQSTNLYDYELESFKNIKTFGRPKNRIITVGQSYEAPNLKFKLVKNPVETQIKLENIIVTLTTVNQSVNEIIATLNVEFDKEIATIMNISKSGYNLNGTVSFLNTSIEELKTKRLRDNNTVDKNTQLYLTENIEDIKKKLDSSARYMNNLKVTEKLYDIENLDTRSLEKIKTLEAKKAALMTSINSLNQIKNTLASQNFEKLISTNAAGISDGIFDATVSELKALYLKKRELANIYTPDSEPMREINRLIYEAKNSSNNSLKNHYSGFYNEIRTINSEIYGLNGDLSTFPEKQRKYLDAERGFNMIQAAYNTLLTKQNETDIRIQSAKSDITIIDPAKNLGQGSIGPNIKATKSSIMGGLLLLPFLILLAREALDNKIRNIKELVSATRIPLLGVIGSSTTESNLTVIDSPQSSISESFRGIRANLRFLSNEDGNSKVILVSSSIGGEGKTYISINIASVLGLSGKKTILLGMDLRKPKIFGDFNINNKFGISNYLTGEVSLKEIINNTIIAGLDVATSGPVPPNPSELLMGDRNQNLIEELKKTYDFIIIDSPPVGLVADAFELMKYANATIYVVRHEYTEKYMLKMITDKYFKHEVENLGIVYNDFSVKQGYGYGYGYGNGYGYGYFDSDINYEEPPIIKLKNLVKRIFKIK